MNEVEKLKSIIKEKSKNILTDKKALDVLEIIKKKIPVGAIDDKLQQVSRFSELPTWLNDALTINETFFFRHPEQYEFLENHLDLIRSEKKSLKVLCGGVSTGEEAYSLAFTLEKYFGTNFNITGVDISSDAISKAQNGTYHESLISRAPEKFQTILRKNLLELSGKEKGLFRVSQNIKERIKFKACNIFTLPLENYDIIFFRNILIYFDQNDKELIYEKLLSHVKGDGLFFIGAGELVPKNTDKAQTVFKTSVLKRAA